MRSTLNNCLHVWKTPAACRGQYVTELTARAKVWVSGPQHQHHNAPAQMIRLCVRASFRSRTIQKPCLYTSTKWLARHQFSSTAWRKEDPRIESMSKEITDEFAVIREDYGKLWRFV